MSAVEGMLLSQKTNAFPCGLHGNRHFVEEFIQEAFGLSQMNPVSRQQQGAFASLQQFKTFLRRAQVVGLRRLFGLADPFGSCLSASFSVL